MSRRRQVLALAGILAVLTWGCQSGHTTNPAGAITPGEVATLPAAPGNFTVLPDGLAYLDIKVGTGDMPQANQAVKVTYSMWIETGGTTKRVAGTTDSPIEFVVGRRQAIAGMEEGVATMRVGGTRRLRIPADLAYGQAGFGNSLIQLVPPDTPVIVDVTLVALGPLAPTPAPTAAASPTAGR